jgi:hypothetical protein
MPSSSSEPSRSPAKKPSRSPAKSSRPPADKARPSRLGLALLNAWNLAAMAACGGLAFLTKSPAPLIVGASLEAGWLAFATRPRASALLFARHHAEAAQVSASARRAALVASLPPSDAARVRRLDERQGEILRLCDGHQHLAHDVLVAEISRLDDVIDAFVDLATQAHRSQAYLGSIDVDDLESETRQAEAAAARAVDAEQRRIARQQLDVLLRRREQADELRQKLQGTRAQLELIESTFRMIANEIMLMRSTDELRGQLDDLVVGVQAVRELQTDAAPADAEPGEARDPLTRRAAARTEAAASRRS